MNSSSHIDSVLPGPVVRVRSSYSALAAEHELKRMMRGTSGKVHSRVLSAEELAERLAARKRPLVPSPLAVVKG